ncbi:MAG: rod shape-determining protein RodA [Clostridiales bacterium]|nr:rod shape-determining protein RodA [Clostridiales bacterium]
MFKNYQIKNYRFRLIAYVVLLCIIGILAIGSAKESVQGRQIVGMVVGMILMVIFSLIDYSLILKFRRIWYVLAIFLLGVLLVPGVGHEVGGATRWIIIGGDNGLQFQPSELCKILLIVFFAAFFMRHHEKINTWKVLLMSVVLAGIPVFLIFREPDLSTTIVTILVFVVMLYISGLSYKIIIPVLAVSIPAVIVSLVLMLQERFPFLQPYQYSRILSWINPDKYPDYARQQTNSIIAIGSGQLWGKGLNNSSITSLKNGNYISEPQTDFIFTVVGEELGFAGCVLIIILIALIVFECIWIAKNAKDFGGRLLACGMAALIGFQAFINMGVATGLMPNTGIPLPFVSYGLTSLVSMFIGIGLVLNVGLQADRRSGADTIAEEKGLHF